MKKSSRLLVLLCFLLFSIILLTQTVSAIKIKCNTDGSINIRDSTKKSDLLAQVKESSDPYFPVDGKWIGYEKPIGPVMVKRYKFESKEGIFVQGTTTKYYLKLGKRRYTITCPAFVFACNILNTTIESCYMRNNTFYAKFFIENIPLIDKKVLRFGSPYGLEYRVDLENGTSYSKSPIKHRKEFKEIVMSQKKLKRGNKYSLFWNSTSSVNRFSMFYDCERGNFYRKAECKEMPTCRYSGDCMKNEYCEQGICQELDCRECEYISKNKCKKHECCDNSVCNDKESCQKNKCIALNCTEAEIVENHQCISLDCKEDEATINHSCVKLKCSEYESAVNHKCEILNCEEDEHIVNHKCEKLDCKWYQKPLAHDCVGVLYHTINKYKDDKE